MKKLQNFFLGVNDDKLFKNKSKEFFSHSFATELNQSFFFYSMAL